MKNIAIILSGCGVFDGSEIYESVCTFLALEKVGAAYQCFAPNISQAKVVNHITGESMNESRNVLVESARLARGNVQDLTELNVNDFDALIFPGGFGAASSLSDFAEKGADCTVIPAIEKVIKAFSDAQKSVGFICITPTIAAKVYADNLQCSVGNDSETSKALALMGANPQECTVDDIIVDTKHKVVSTPAFMLGQNISEVAAGIEKLVNAIVTM